MIEEFLEIIQIFDAKWSEKIKKEKFRLYNNELINKIKEVQNKLQLMNDYIEQGGLLEDGDDLMAAEIDEENLSLE